MIAACAGGPLDGPALPIASPMLDREMLVDDRPAPSAGPDPLCWATQVALLVLLSPALFAALLIGGIGIATVGVARLVQRVATSLVPRAVAARVAPG